MLILEIRLWTQHTMEILYVVYRIKHFVIFLKDVNVGVGNPVMEIQLDDNSVCDIRN